MTKDKTLKIVYIIFAIIAITLLFVNDNGVIKYFSLKTEIKELNEKIESTKFQIEKLNSEIDSLENSDVKIEQVARDRYRMKYEDEIPVRINKQ
ncbi:MAG: septum formation initiator family protein [Melioribacteraceae bacterium]|jgi:cell division protein FtsB|nr:septum formation initiator family protein [Melioribacteraceae bacterium]